MKTLKEYQEVRKSNLKIETANHFINSVAETEDESTMLSHLKELVKEEMIYKMKQRLDNLAVVYN